MTLFFSYQCFKRLCDSLCSLVLLVLFVPLLFIVSLLLWLQSDGPIFFTQSRAGRNGRIFRLIKFRSMSDKVDSFGNLLPDSNRLTGVGMWLRKTSMDELPSLINVIRGDMSLIGPRPLLVEYLLLYNSNQFRRHEVRPGLSGWAQVNGRNAISWEEKFRLDVWYVDHQSFWLDLRIFLLTIWKVIRREGISAAGEATIARFTGTAGIE